MKVLNLINLYNAEIRKSSLSNVRGGSDIKCNCGQGSPAVAVSAQAPGGDLLCVCPDTVSYVSTKNKSGKN
jgi:hypothetical protein